MIFTNKKKESCEEKQPSNQSQKTSFTDLGARKQWWAPVWTGLVMDQEAKHYRGMKNAIWLFLYLLLNANRRSGFLMRKIKTISLDMGISRDTVLRWLNTLRRHEYISTVNTGRCLLIQIKKWKALPDRGKSPYQKRWTSGFTGWKNPTSQKAFPSQNPVHFGQKQPNFSGPKDINNK